MWSDRLDLIVKEYNNSYHSTIKDTPARVHKRGRQNVAQQKIVENRIEEWTKTWRNYPELSIGDKVRIHILTEGQQRKMEKAHMTKKYVPQWSEEVFEVFKIVGDASQTTKPKYIVVDINGEELPKGFYRHDLQKIDASELHL